MKAYELEAIVEADGKVQFPDFSLNSSFPELKTVKLILLIPEPDSLEEDPEDSFSAESFQRSRQQAICGNTLPLSSLWEEEEQNSVDEH